MVFGWFKEKGEGIPLQVRDSNDYAGVGGINYKTAERLRVHSYSMYDADQQGRYRFNGDEIEISKGNSNIWISVACGAIFPSEPNNIIRIDYATQAELGVKAGDTVYVRKR